MWGSDKKFEITFWIDNTATPLYSFAQKLLLTAAVAAAVVAIELMPSHVSKQSKRLPKGTPIPKKLYHLTTDS